VDRAALHRVRQILRVSRLVEPGGEVADPVKGWVAEVARAVGIAGVAVSEDARKRRGGALRESGVRPPCGGQRDATLGVDAIHGQSPSEQPANRSQLDRGRLHQVEVADHGHSPGVLVEPAGVRTLDWSGDAAESALEDLTVIVDKGVVGNVGPAQRAAVIGVNRPDDARRVFGRVVVASCRVVHDPRPYPVVVQPVRRTASTHQRPNRRG